MTAATNNSPALLQASHTLPSGDFWEACWLKIQLKALILLVPGRGFEPLANGLQNRCSTTELTRQNKHLAR